MTDYFANGTDIRNEKYLTKTIAEFNTQSKRITFDKINHAENKEPFLNFDFIKGVPVFIFNDKWTLNGAQAPKVIETIIDIAAKD